MKNTLNNEVLLIGRVKSNMIKIKSNNNKAVKMIINVESDNDQNIKYNIPVIFENPDYEHLKKCKNESIAISGHIDTKWGFKIIVDSYVSKLDNNILFKI